ncbi:MAG: class I SAM-dependent rRNA methyltransferase [Proteobacteria bacterium]|nr:class I SAM-dependent rRNA methyltransferase [Pseudomonadota bacterium]
MDCLSLKKPYIDKIRKGYPWVFAQALITPKQSISPGKLVYIGDGKKKPFAIGYYNEHSKIACRILTLAWKTEINTAFFFDRFSKALQLREQKFNAPYYRLVHSEGDLLPGLIIDRFGDTVVCQTGTAGMENLKPVWLEALQHLLKPKCVIFKDNIPSRLKEDLPIQVSIVLGNPEPIISVFEHDHQFFTSLLEGQKTGWFYDQRANRLWLSPYCKNKTVLDLYTYHGGFGIYAAKAGAKNVTLVDSSALAIQHAKMAASANHLSQCEFINEEVFSLLDQFLAQQKQFEVVIADPPAFVKQLKHQGAGLRGYQKLAKRCAQLVAPKGLLFVASCSHHASNEAFRQAIEMGIHKTGRTFTLLRKGQADSDHPVHPLLPESHYLKALLYQLS